jgi:hypothetical protein
LEEITSFSEDKEGMAYDLRQRYAKIVADHMEDVAICRKNENHQVYFKALDDLYIQIACKAFKNKDDKIRYEDLINQATIVANRYPTVFLGQANNQLAHSEIDNILKKVHLLLYEKMEESKMLGSKDYDDEDEL